MHIGKGLQEVLTIKINWSKLLINQFKSFLRLSLVYPLHFSIYSLYIHVWIEHHKGIQKEIKPVLSITCLFYRHDEWQQYIELNGRVLRTFLCYRSYPVRLKRSVFLQHDYFTYGIHLTKLSFGRFFRQYNSMRVLQTS